ncbi:MAG TPA: ornithine cyclodeaminase family protein [Caulobacteraceae bacterium]|jgi:ornithine cyclodeaminase|nr:ornithine cyclodeaminase family protein [Caulobacteraceae bacterium]
MALRVIDRETVRRILTYEACIPLMREAMTALSQGRTTQVLRQLLPVGGGSVFGVMPGAMDQTFGAKLISVFPGNFAKGLQSHQGGVLLFEPEGGAPVALIHAGEVTAIRTAAASAAATDVLARADAATLALLGYGEQALTHARAMVHVRPVREVRIWGRSAERAGVLATRLEAELKLPVVVAASPREAVAGADLICAVSAAREPILLGQDVADGAHVNLVGSSNAGPREADDALVVRGRIFADHREGVLRQGAEVLHAIQAGLIGEDHVLGEIGEVMDGSKPGRVSAADVTIYKSLGAIVQDLASGWFIYRQAVELGLGTEAAF